MPTRGPLAEQARRAIGRDGATRRSKGHREQRPDHAVAKIECAGQCRVGQLKGCATTVEILDAVPCVGA